MRITAAAVALILLTGTAYAQAPTINLWADDKFVDPERAEKQREIDKAYKDKIKNLPAQAPASNDPWGNVRASEGPQNKQTGSKNR
jgi:hypothetical protein